MKQRNPITVLILSFITLGIYSWYWLVKTKGEMNQQGASIPTAWIWLIPFIGILWWLWKYSEAVEHVTSNKLSGVLAFILMWLLGSIGHAIVQDYFNKSSPQNAPGAPVAQGAPDVSISQPSVEPQQPVATMNSEPSTGAVPAHSQPMSPGVQPSAPQDITSPQSIAPTASPEQPPQTPPVS